MSLTRTCRRLGATLFRRGLTLVRATSSRLATLPCAGLMMLPAASQAHLVNSGLGPFYDGALHMLMSAEALLGLLALALLAGRHGANIARATVVTLPVTWLLAGLLGLYASGSVELAELSIVSFMLLGSLVALDARLPPVLITALAGAYGTLHGVLDGAALASMDADLTSLFGIVLVALLLVLLVSAVVAPLKAFWIGIAVRIMGSWVVAVGILMLAWMTHGGI